MPCLQITLGAPELQGGSHSLSQVTRVFDYTRITGPSAHGRTGPMENVKCVDVAPCSDIYDKGRTSFASLRVAYLTISS